MRQIIFTERVTGATNDVLADAYREVTGGVPRPFVIDVRGLQWADRSARRGEAELRPLIQRIAVVARSPVVRVIVAFFVRLQRPPYPMRVFDSVTEAEAWAREGRAP